MSAVLAALQLFAAAASPAPAPYGYVLFCARNAQECGHEDRSAAQGDAPLSPLWDEVLGRANTAPGPTPGSVRADNLVRRLAAASETRFADAAAPRAMTAETYARLRQVNRDVNRRIRPRTDAQAFGVSDYWTLPLSTGARAEGDCEDFVLQKRSDLRRAGLDLGAMSVAIVRTPRGDAHAVLLVNTERGVLVLDNLTSRVDRLERSPYRIMMREVFGAPDTWIRGDAG